MSDLVGGVAVGAVGFAVTAAVLRLGGPVLAHPYLSRENYRGAAIPSGAGVFLVGGVILVDGARAALAAVADIGSAEAGGWIPVVVAVAAFAFLGLVDDLLGDGSIRGLRGHVGALLHGRLTTGFVKLAGGAAVALTLATALDEPRPQALVDAAVIALAANLGNLLDRAPGRVGKWTLVLGAPVAVAAGPGTGHALAMVLGATLASLGGDVRERFMLGDTGANAVGAAVGVTAVIAFGPGARQVTAAVLFALTLASERVSFSRVIAVVPPLRWFDGLGRRQGSSSGTRRSAPGPTP